MNKISSLACSISRGVFQPRRVKTAIQIAAQNRVPQLLAVNTQLMGSPGFRDQLTRVNGSPVP
jgi:hypothetical protein